MPYVGSEPSSGLFQELDALTASATDDYTLKLNGADYFPETVNNLLVSINGVIQGGSTMALNGAVLTVGATLSSADTIDFVRVFGNVGSVSTPTDGSVTANKIGTGAVDLTSKVTGVLPFANGGASDVNSVVETFYYHSGDIAESNNAILDATWTRDTSNGTANKNGGMSASSGIWTFPSTGIWQVTLLLYYYVSAAHVARGITLRHTPDNGSNHNNVFSMYNNFYESNGHSSITMPWTFNITDTSNQKISYKIAGDNITVGGGSAIGGTRLNFIKLCPSV